MSTTILPRQSSTRSPITGVSQTASFCRIKEVFLKMAGIKANIYLGASLIRTASRHVVENYVSVAEKRKKVT